MSTSAMTCVPGAEHAFAANAPDFGAGIGLHLQLTHGVPVLPPAEIPSLVTADARFPNTLSDVRLNPDDIAREWRAQVARLRLWGIEPDHIDTHHNVHMHPKHGEVLAAYADLAAELGVPCRGGRPPVVGQLRRRGLVCPDGLVYYAEINAMMKKLDRRRAASGTDDPVIELCCHPGFADDDLAAIVLNRDAMASRDVERIALCSPELRSRLNADGWMIVRYRDIEELQRNRRTEPAGLLRRLFRRPAWA